MRRALLLAISSALVATVIACGDGELPGTATESPSPTASPTAAPSATVPGAVASLREVDFTDSSIAGPLIDAAGGGEVRAERVQFRDVVAHDGVDEAIVIVESGGTMGDLGAGVFTLVEGQPTLVQFIATAGRIELRLDLVVAIEGVWAANDPQCCPSQLHEVSYQWDGARFTAITDQVVPNPDP